MRFTSRTARLKYSRCPIPTDNNWIQSLSINDRGEMMGSVNGAWTNNAPRSSLQGYRDGRLATLLAGNALGTYDDVVINDSGHFAFTNGENINGLFWASIGNAQDIGTKVVPASNDSFATWLNERTPSSVTLVVPRGPGVCGWGARSGSYTAAPGDHGHDGKRYQR